MSAGDKNTWEEFFDGHAEIYDGNEFTKNTVAAAICLCEGSFGLLGPADDRPGRD